MDSRTILICTLLVFALTYVNCVQTINGRIKITVGTSAGYTEVAAFLRNQLIPTFNSYKKFLDIEFVPWGRTARDTNGTLSCEFGEYDCWANRMHRCVLNHLRGNSQAQVDYMSCEFTEPFPAFETGSYRCATAAGMRMVNSDFCVSNPNRDTLDLEAEAAAFQPMEALNTVPYVLFNGNTNPQENSQAHTRLSSMVCFALADDPNSGIVSCQI